MTNHRPRWSRSLRSEEMKSKKRRKMTIGEVRLGDRFHGTPKERLVGIQKSHHESTCSVSRARAHLERAAEFLDKEPTAENRAYISNAIFDARAHLDVAARRNQYDNACLWDLVARASKAKRK